MSANVTIEDLARAAGVSRQTVSRAMNGMPRISESTRAHIIRLAEELGYRPSRFASNLARASKSKVVGVVVDSFRNPYYSELTADLLDRANENGWQVTVSSHENQDELALIARLAGEVDAIVAYVGGLEKTDLMAAARGVPLVLLERTTTAEGISSVDFDFDAGFAELLTSLRSTGSRRFGLLESHHVGEDYRPSTRRTAFEGNVGADSRDAVVVCDAEAQSVDAGERGLHDLLTAYPQTDTVIAFSDLMAMGALRAARSRNLRVPHDLRVVGIDGLSLGAVTSPSLTSLALVGTDYSVQIADVLATIFDGANRGAMHRSVAPVIKWREST